MTPVLSKTRDHHLEMTGEYFSPIWMECLKPDASSCADDSDTDTDINSFTTVDLQTDSTASDGRSVERDGEQHSNIKNWRSRLINWLFGVPVPLEAENLGQDLVCAIDQPDADEEAIETDHTEGDKTSYRSRPSYLSNVVAECKISIEGITVETKANMLVGQRWLSKKMLSDGLRPTHIARILPIAVQLLFVPDKYQMLAVQMRSSKAILDRLDEYNVSYTARHPPSIFNWFGAVRRRPVVEG